MITYRKLICIVLLTLFYASANDAGSDRTFEILRHKPGFREKNSKVTSGKLLFEAEELDLSGLQLTELPYEFSMLSNLKVLNIQNNKLTKLPEMLDKLKNLEVIYAQNNLLKELPKNIGKLESLKKLVLTNNSLSFLPTSICQPAKLNTLIFDNNKFLEIPKLLADCKELDSLSFSHNEIRYLPKFLAKTPKLRWLRVPSNKIQEIPEAILESDSIKTLIITDNPLSKKTLSGGKTKFDIWGPKDNRFWFLAEGASKKCLRIEKGSLGPEIASCNESLMSTYFQMQHTLDRRSFFLSRGDQCLEIDKKDNSFIASLKDCNYSDKQKFRMWKLPAESIYQDQIVSLQYNQCIRFSENKFTLGGCQNHPATLFYIRPMLPRIIFPEPIAPSNNNKLSLEKTTTTLGPPRYDVLLIATDTLRRDALAQGGKDILKFFSDANSLSLEQQWSAATATHLAFFSLFYSQFAFKRDGYLKDQPRFLGAPFLNFLNSSGMETQFFAHSDLFYCIKDGKEYKKADVELDQMRLLIGENSLSMTTCQKLNPDKYKEYYERHNNLKSWAQKDQAITDEFIKFNTSARQLSAPKFSLLYWFSPHYPYNWNEDLQGTKTPSFQNDATHETVDWVKNSYDENVRIKFKNSYHNAVLEVNRQFSRLVNNEKIGPQIRDNTIVIFMADHGENLYEQNYLQHGGPGFKSLMNVPILLRLPNGHPYIKRPHRDFIRTIDVLPTLMDLLEFKPSDELKNLKKSFDGSSIYDLSSKACNITVTPNGYEKYPDQFVISTPSAKVYVEFSRTQVFHGDKNPPSNSKELNLYLITDHDDKPIYIPEANTLTQKTLSEFSSSVELLLKKHGVNQCIFDLLGKNYQKVTY